MCRRFKHISLWVGIIVTMVLTSCGTRAPRYDFQSLAHAAVRLDMDIDEKDNHALYIEAARWMGVPYRYGGKTMRGVDCSGFVMNVFREVYGKSLARSSADMLKRNCRKVGRAKLKEGDLVFFRTGRGKRKVPNHVGIYLKNGKFIHASTSRGVIVSSLSEPYYVRTWLTGGRVK